MKPRTLTAALSAAGLLLTGCSGSDAGDTGDGALVTESADTAEYAELAPTDLELNFHITEQHYFAVWNVAWIVQPEVQGDVQLEPDSNWLVTYETTAPTAPMFTGATYSFTVHVDAAGEISYSGNGLNVDSHGINAHPDRLEVEITNVTRI